MPVWTARADVSAIVHELVPHALSLVGEIDPDDPSLAFPGAFVCNRIGPYLLSRGDPYRAEELLRLGLEFLGGEDTEEASLRGSLLTNLATILHERGELRSAEAMLREALRLKEENAGDDDFLIATTTAGLGVVLDIQGRLEEAERCHERAREVYERHQYPMGLADSLTDLADIARKRGNDEKGLQLAHRAAQIADGDGECGEESVRARLTLTTIYEEVGDGTSALRVAREARDVAERRVGKSANLARAMAAYGRILNTMGLLEDGNLLLEEALEMFETMESPAHLEAARIKGNLGLGLLKGAEFRRAYDLLRESDARIEELLPPDHVTSVTSKHLLAEALAALGHMDEAAATIEGALEGMGQGHPDLEDALRVQLAMFQRRGGI